MPVVGMVVGAVAAVGSYKAQKKAAAAQQQQERLQTQRSQRQTIREGQLARASAMAAGATYGAMDGSGLQGGLASVGSQVGGALGYSSAMSGLSQKITKYNTRAQGLSALSSLSFTAADWMRSRRESSGQQPPRVSY